MNSDRIVNFSVNSATGLSFFLANVATNQHTQTASYHTDLFIQQVDAVTNGKFDRLTSLATDTCGAMRAFPEEVKKRPETSGMFLTLCDSHGLQLLVKDIVDSSTSISLYKNTLAEAQFLSGLLRRSNKTIGYLKNLIQQHRGDRRIPRLRVFAVSIITRWGSQYRVVDSLVENRVVLLEGVTRGGLFRDSYGRLSKDGTKAVNLIEDKSFWKRCETLHTLLKVGIPIEFYSSTMLISHRSSQTQSYVQKAIAQQLEL